MSLPMKILCINDDNRPKEIPVEKWIVKDMVYTLIGVQNLLSSHSFGFELDEITLDETCFPYHYFNPDRFVPLDAIMQDMEHQIDEIINPTIA
jgi:hypothetical protein